MLALVTRVIKDNRTFFIANAFIWVLFIWMYVAFFPSVSENAAQLQEAFKSYPESFFKAFSINMDVMFTNLEGFLSIEYYSIVWPILMVIFVLTYGSFTIAGEIDRGTIEVLLAQPISRTKIYWAKYLAGVILILAFVFLSNFSVVPFTMLYHVKFQWQALLTISALGFLFSLSVFSVTTMLSSLFSSRAKAASLAGGVLIAMYVLNIISKFKVSVDNLKYLSFFHYFDHSAALIDNHISALAVAVFLGVSLTCTLAGLIAFIKRDIAT